MGWLVRLLLDLSLEVVMAATCAYWWAERIAEKMRRISARFFRDDVKITGSVGRVRRHTFQFRWSVDVGS